VIVSSGAAWAGGARIAVYAATKGFDLLFGESLWAEMQPFGVEVLSMVLGVTDTPAFRSHLVRDGIDPAGVEMADPHEIVAAAFANLGAGPTWIAEGVSPDGPAHQVSRARQERVSATSEMTARLYGIHD
jgi:short-subunit dehydrogenase